MDKLVLGALEVDHVDEGMLLREHYVATVVSLGVIGTGTDRRQLSCSAALSVEVSLEIAV